MLARPTAGGALCIAPAQELGVADKRNVDLPLERVVLARSTAGGALRIAPAQALRVADKGNVAVRA